MSLRTRIEREKNSLVIIRRFILISLLILIRMENFKAAVKLPWSQNLIPKCLLMISIHVFIDTQNVRERLKKFPKSRVVNYAKNFWSKKVSPYQNWEKFWREIYTREIKISRGCNQGWIFSERAFSFQVIRWHHWLLVIPITLRWVIKMSFFPCRKRKFPSNLQVILSIYRSFSLRTVAQLAFRWFFPAEYYANSLAYRVVSHPILVFVVMRSFWVCLRFVASCFGSSSKRSFKLNFFFLCSVISSQA